MRIISWNIELGRNVDRPLHSVGFERITNHSMKSFRRFGRAFVLDHLYVRSFNVRSVGVEMSSIASDHQSVRADIEVVSCLT